YAVTIRQYFLLEIVSRINVETDSEFGFIILNNFLRMMERQRLNILSLMSIETQHNFLQFMVIWRNNSKKIAVLLLYIKTGPLESGFLNLKTGDTVQSIGLYNSIGLGCIIFVGFTLQKIPALTVFLKSISNNLPVLFLIFLHTLNAMLV